MTNQLVPVQVDGELVTPSRVEDDDPLDVIGHLNELRERRISALEEVMAARWPHRWLISVRLRRCLRRSVRSYGPGTTWHERRAAWMTYEWLTRS